MPFRISFQLRLTFGLHRHHFHKRLLFLIERSGSLHFRLRVGTLSVSLSLMGRRAKRSLASPIGLLRDYRRDFIR
jgi:hypothetical protein